MDDRKQEGQRPVESRELLEPLNYDRTRPVTPDQTWETQRPVKSRELPEPLWADRTCPITPDQTFLASDELLR